MLYFTIPPNFNGVIRKRFLDMLSKKTNTVDSKDKILDGFLQFTLTKCMDILNARSGSIFLLDNKTEELVLRASRNGSEQLKEGLRQTLGEGIAGLVASSREPVVVEDINNDSRFLNRRRFYHYQTNSFLSVPLEYSGELIGVINISERDANKVFDNQDLKLLLDLCSFFAFFVHQFANYSMDDGINPETNFSLPGRIATGLIHELNNPLDGIIRYVNLSLNSLGEESIVKQYLLEAKGGLNRIVKIVRTLLDFRRVATYSPQTIDISHVFNESIFLMEHYFINSRIKITKHLERDLPMVYDFGLKLVFTNILKNACDALAEDGGIITVSTVKQEGFIDIIIADTGPGIPEEIKNNIFEPFFTTKEIGKGSGLGLPICLNIIERYKGCIIVESEKGKGAKFTIRIPEEAIVKNKDVK